MTEIPDYNTLCMAPLWMFYEAGKIELARLEALSPGSPDVDWAYIKGCKAQLRTEIASFETRFPDYQRPDPIQQENPRTTVMNKTEALALLTDGFKIVRPDAAKKLCQLLGVPFTDDLIEHDYVINDLISTRGGNEAGVDCLTLAYYAIKQLGLGPAPGMLYSNRAMQAVANTDLLKQALQM